MTEKEKMPDVLSRCSQQQCTATSTTTQRLLQPNDNDEPGFAPAAERKQDRQRPPSHTGAAATTNAAARSSNNSPPVPLDTVVISHQQAAGGGERVGPPPPPEDSHRAVHRIRLSALDHNYVCVESAANRQRCSVIVVVKADGYGHGAIATALHLADVCGCDAFAVATLEEGVALRKAFQNNPPGKWNKNLAALFHTQDVAPAALFQDVPAVVSVAPTVGSSTQDSSDLQSRSQSLASSVSCARTMRPNKIRILVLGPPVGFPRCFDDYYHHDIDVMVSGPEAARALMEWVVNENERKRAQAERAAAQTKAEALSGQNVPRDDTMKAPSNNGAENSTAEPNNKNKVFSGGGDSRPAKLALPPASTLNAVQGQDLVREVRAILMNQTKVATEAAQAPNPRSTLASGATSAESSVSSGEQQQQSTSMNRPTKPAQPFGGIEAAAKSSRHREMAAARANEVFREDVSSSDSLNANGTSAVDTFNVSGPGPARKYLRWHALVDSGMGRLGFRTEPVKEGEDRMDTVDTIRELVDAEIHNNAPIEFCGMCTHMAEANDTSNYTHTQIGKFISLLKRVRAAGIFIPTVSTDNSAALLTTTLTHFDPKEILSQAQSDTRGYVRTGGAIYGQRPAFKQLRAVSTLMASVRHVAVLKKGESVGYDRAYTAPYDVRIATLTIGFADGYPRELGNGIGKVAIRGAVYPIAGNVCMDMTMVELGPAEDETGLGVTVGDTAVLWGPLDEDEDEGLVRLQDIAATLKTTQSALTCGLDKIRVRRQFI